MNSEIIASAVFGVLLGISVLRLVDMFAEVTTMAIKRRMVRKEFKAIADLLAEVMRREIENAKHRSETTKAKSTKASPSRAKKSGTRATGTSKAKVQATKKGV